MNDLLTPPAADGSVDLLRIVIAPSAILKTKCRAVGAGDDDAVRALIPRMFATMYKAPGIGLAAPQVGENLRLIVVDVGPEDKRQPYALINPEVVAASDETSTREEGCLSLPNQFADITRPSVVKVRYVDQAGARREVDADGLLATCLQHEIDHLNGILFVDHLSMLKRNMIMRRLVKEQREKRDGGR
ncbi:peptide deformylase [Rhodopila sp.]|jgi:peptide deformylase|uniref:peptide deformylase n=1 Tax=Rhodopila sp. TaxID=2480087 RepID=UPI002CBE43CA|nr:peptide deformylase [Rhodopila sp.]HVZ09062.1 peptide deformylase [Rhodopila sp.]